MAKVRLAQAHICFWQGHIETAQTIAMETLESVQEQQHMQLLTQAQSILGSILSASGHYAEADEYFSQAIHTSQKFGLRLEYARALYSFGVALLQRNQPEDATLQQGLRYLHEAQNIFVECHAAIDLEKVKRIIAA